MFISLTVCVDWQGRTSVNDKSKPVILVNFSFNLKCSGWMISITNQHYYKLIETKLKSKTRCEKAFY